MIPDSEVIISPLNGEELIRVGTAKRIVREPDYTYFLLIPVCYSPSENRYHRVLPDYLLPYKHYTLNTILRAVNDDQDLDLYDLPSDSSRSRWKKLNHSLFKRKSDLKLSDSPPSLSVSLHHDPSCVDTGYVSPVLPNRPMHKRL